LIENTAGMALRWVRWLEEVRRLGAGAGNQGGVCLDRRICVRLAMTSHVKSDERAICGRLTGRGKGNWIGKCVCASCERFEDPLGGRVDGTSISGTGTAWRASIRADLRQPRLGVCRRGIGQGAAFCWRRPMMIPARRRMWRNCGSWAAREAGPGAAPGCSLLTRR